MNNNFLSEQKTKLLAEQSRIIADLASISTKTGAGFKPNSPDYGDSLDDTALETEAYENNLEIERTLLGLKSQIEEALLKIESGEYGFCTEDGEKHAIEKERLEAFPEAQKCLKHTPE